MASIENSERQLAETTGRLTELLNEMKTTDKNSDHDMDSHQDTND